MKNSQIVLIQIYCHNLPGSRFEGKNAVRLGIQKGKEVVDDVPADVREVLFTVPLRVEPDSMTGQPNFLGPFAQGRSQERFIYLCWGKRINKGWEGFRRVKVHLKHLTWQQIEAALQQGQPIKFSFDMTDAKGGPVCGSLNLHGNKPTR
jgi:hypothetical protein